MGEGVILTSPDGVDVDDRRNRTRNIGDAIVSIIYGGGQFVAGGSAVDIFGDHDPTPVFTSSDGVTWSRHVLSQAPGPAVLGLAWNGTRYVAVGDGIVSGDPRTVAVVDATR